jgi:hypothetical protein
VKRSNVEEKNAKTYEKENALPLTRRFGERGGAKHFPAYRMQIEEFAKINAVRFNNEDDLIALFVFCESLNTSR